MKVKVVVDTNVIITALISGDSSLLTKLLDSKISLVSPKFIITELFKHAPRIFSQSNLPKDSVLRLLSLLIDRIYLFNEKQISIGNWVEANRLCRDVDVKDMSFVALALENEAYLWTNDKKLKLGLKRMGFFKIYK